MSIPNWAKTYIRSEKLDDIHRAVKDAENKTAGEIVPMIVRKSSTIGHVPLLIMCLLVIGVLSLDLLVVEMTYFNNYYLWCFINFVVVIGLTTFLSRFDWIRRVLTNASDQISQVEMRAEVEFFEAGINQTRDATGVLLFISVLERRAVVLADKAIADKVPAETWDEICQILVSGCKDKEVERAFVEAISKCGDILKVHFPRKTDDINELSDQFIIKD
ncbi:MAG: hypothetical protein KDD37_10640 [Bdellovibrionales bacterium]|nr:hypothetical protein [Bdellovibrionales bacterium]